MSSSRSRRDALQEVVRRGAVELGTEAHARARRADRPGARRGATRAPHSTSSSSRPTRPRAENSRITEEHVEDAARKRPVIYDKNADAHYDFTSGVHQVDAGVAIPMPRLYYLAAMLEGGEDARFIARRMIVLASEDIGNADPRALLVAVARRAGRWSTSALPEARPQTSRRLRSTSLGHRSRTRATPRSARQPRTCASTGM